MDTFCLQEVFFADIQRQVYRELKDRYPHVLTATDLTASDTDPARACAPLDLQAFGACFLMQCASSEGDAMLVCAVERSVYREFQVG